MDDRLQDLSADELSTVLAGNNIIETIKEALTGGHGHDSSVYVRRVFG